MMNCSRKRRICGSCLGLFVLAILVPIIAFAADPWKKIAVTPQNDYWYVEQGVAFSSRGEIRTVRTALKCVPDENSDIAQNVRKGLIQDGITKGDFSYFVQSVEIDCRKKKVAVSQIQFFDIDDAAVTVQGFEPSREYPATPGSTYGIVTADLCRDRTGLLDEFKRGDLYYYLSLGLD